MQISEFFTSHSSSLSQDLHKPSLQTNPEKQSEVPEQPNKASKLILNMDGRVIR